MSIDTCMVHACMDQITVFQTGSVEYMDRNMYLASLANAICWTIYAGISSDLFILVRKLLLETLHLLPHPVSHLGTVVSNQAALS